MVPVPKKKPKRCTFSISDRDGTFLGGSHLPSWKVVCFVNAWVRKSFCHSEVIECLGVASRTSVDWRSFCSEVVLKWFEEQPQIGGEGVIVEIDETHFAKRKYERGKVLDSICIFGGIERESKKIFLVPIVEEGQDRSEETLLPLIKKFIHPGSIIYSDKWKSYMTLPDEGFRMSSVEWPVSEDPTINTQTVKRLWRDLKEWEKKPGMETQFFKQYLAHYIFCRNSKKNAFHDFFVAAGKLYKPRN